MDCNCTGDNLAATGMGSPTGQKTKLISRLQTGSPGDGGRAGPAAGLLTRVAGGPERPSP